MTVKRAPAGNEPQRQTPPADDRNPPCLMRGHTIPPCHSRRLQPPSVIPDVFNRESMAFPMQDHTNEGTEEKDSGFPLTTGGHDRGDRRVCQREPSGHDGGDRAGMPKGPEQACQQACRIHGVSHAGPHDSFHIIPDVFNPLPSFPTFLIGNPWPFPCRATRMKGQKRKNLDSR